MAQLKVTRTCLYCGNEFETAAYRINHGRGNFCNKSCAAKYTPPLEISFWTRAQRSDDKDGCWEWQGQRDPRPNSNYGVFNDKGAHRISWELHYGAIPKGMSVLHRCDNPPCVRPDHLFLGTQSDNMHDMAAKGRARGWNYG